MNIEQLRKDYSSKPLDIGDLNTSPYEQFSIWFLETLKLNLIEPNAFTLATTDRMGNVSCRTVLMKSFDGRGIGFFTSFESRKAKQMKENPKAAGTFWWKELERQVIFEGSVEKISDDEAVAYYSIRPRMSQISAWASRQSSVLASRNQLEEEYTRFERKFEGKPVPKPTSWGGYRIVPVRFEFWQGRSNRLHDRFEYSYHENGWRIVRLSP